MMLKRLLRTGAALALCVGVLAAPLAAEARDADDVIDDVRERLEELETFSCSFTWERVWLQADRTTTIDGTIVMKRPYLLRVEYSGHVLVVDGENTWSYLTANNQVQISTFEEGTGEFPSPRTIFRQYAGDREARLTGTEEIHGRECDVIDLVSDDPDAVRVTVWIDRKLDFPLKTIELAPNGNSSTHVLRGIELNGPVDDDQFVFQPPDGVTIIDMRE